MRLRTNTLIGIAASAGALGATSVMSAMARLETRWRDQQQSQLHRALVDILLNTLSAGDALTERHSRRVADLSDVVFDVYGLRGEAHSTLRLAALLHDLGKIDDRFFDILHSCEPLTPEQRKKIEEHPDESADILGPLRPIHPGLTEIVEAHHECWDGSGYPDGLAGEEIPLGARIISVADVFDALTQHRSYREGMPVEDAMEEIRSGAGTRFDPGVVDRVSMPDIFEQWRTIAVDGREEEKKAPE